MWLPGQSRHVVTNVIGSVVGLGIEGNARRGTGNGSEAWQGIQSAKEIPLSIWRNSLPFRWFLQSPSPFLSLTTPDSATPSSSHAHPILYPLSRAACKPYQNNIKLTNNFRWRVARMRGFWHDLLSTGISVFVSLTHTHTHVHTHTHRETHTDIDS